MNRYTIRCVGFDEQQVESISAIVDLAGLALNDAWSFSDSEDSDVVLINMNSEAGKQMFSAQTEGLPDYRLILSAEAIDERLQDYWFLTKKNTAPPSLRELIDLFNQIGAFLSQLAEKTEEESIITRIEAESQLDLSPQEPVIDKSPDKAIGKDTRKLLPKNYLFGLILQAEKDQICRIISLKGYPSLTICPPEDSYCFAGTEPELNVLCRALPKQLKVKKVSKSKLQQEQNTLESAIKTPLKVLKTQAVIQASQGRILNGHSPDMDVMLTRLPDFDTLPILAQYRKIAEQMIGSAMNLFSVAEKLRVPISDVFDFYNVCYLFGDISIDRQSAKQQKVFESRNSKMLSFFLKPFLRKNQTKNGA